MLNQCTDIAAIEHIQIGHTVMGELELLFAHFVAPVDYV